MIKCDNRPEIFAESLNGVSLGTTFFVPYRILGYTGDRLPIGQYP